MVGVAGKSKACNACRARKVGCDLRQPECGQCLKRRKQCPGYHRETVFLSHYTTEGATPTTTTPSRSPSAKAVSRSVSNGTLAAATAAKKKGGPAAKKKNNTYEEPRLQAQLHSQYAFRDLFIADLLETYLPQSNLSPTEPTSWLQIAVNIPEPGEAFYNALSALSLAVAGRTRLDPDLSNEGSRKYGLALHELQKALWDDQRMYEDQTLAACMTLICYEIYECPAPNLKGWISHAQGMSRLIEARGPSMHRSPLAHELYKEYRYLTIMQTLATRKASFIHEAQWSSEPWNGIRKSADQRLYDLGSELSKILASADASKLIPDPERLLREKTALIARCQDLDRRLEDWFSSLSEELPLPHYWPRFSNIENPIDQFEEHKVFPISFEFSNLKTAKTLIDYWVLLIILYSTILITYRQLAGSSQTDESPHGPEHPADSRGAQARISPDRSRLPMLADKYKPKNLFSIANNISQSMEYMLSKHTGILGSSWAFFALKAAMQCYKYRPGRELLWLQELMQTIASEQSPKFGPVYALADWSNMSQA